MHLATKQERRQYERYAVSQDLYLIFRPDFQKIGRLRDISKGGVCFDYTNLGGGKTPKNVEIDIFSAKRELHLTRIYCRVVYDLPIEPQSTFKRISLRRCGLEFLTPSEQQSLKLATLM